MTSSTNFELKGFKEFEELLRALPEELAAKTLKTAFFEGAKIVRDAARQNCPVGKAENEASDGKFPLGSVKRSIRIARPTKKQSLRQEMLIYRVLAGGRKAPHAWLLEYGSKERTQKKTGRFTGVMPAHPYMRPAADSKAGSAIGAITKSLHDGITKSAVALAKRVGALK